MKLTIIKTMNGKHDRDAFTASLINENATLVTENSELRSKCEYLEQTVNTLRKQVEHLTDGSIDDEEYNPMCTIDECVHNKLGECDRKVCVYSDDYDNDEYKPLDPTYHIEYIEFNPNGTIKHIQWRKNQY